MSGTPQVTTQFQGESSVDPTGFEGTVWGPEAISEDVAVFQVQLDRSREALLARLNEAPVVMGPRPSRA